MRKFEMCHITYARMVGLTLFDQLTTLKLTA
jgi:hypothetical protein